MIAYKVPAHTALAGGAVDDIFSRSVVIVGVFIADFTTEIAEVDKVKVCCCDIEGGISLISCN